MAKQGCDNNKDNKGMRDAVRKQAFTKACDREREIGE
jgi:hypothetical protein